MNHSNNEYQGYKNLLAQYNPENIVQEYIKSTLKDFCKKFFGELYENKELMNSLYIAGGTISNLYHFYIDTYPFHEDFSKYRKLLPETDVDVYSTISGTPRFRESISPILTKYKANILNKTEFENLSATSQKYKTKAWIIDTCTNPNIFVRKVQFIEYITGKPHNVAASFDFEHCKPYYLIGEDRLVISTEQLQIIQKKELIHYVNNSENPGERLRKYINRGWTKQKTHYKMKAPLDDILPNDPIPF